MRFEEYQQTYHSFLISVHQTEVISRISLATLDNFPHNLPRRIKEPYIELIEPIGESWARFYETGEDVSINVDFDEDLVLASMADLFTLPMITGSFDHVRDFHRQAATQWLISVSAYLDSFVTDCVRAICYSQPKVMKGNRTLDYDTIIESAIDPGSTAELLVALIEKFARHFSDNSIPARIEILNKQMGVGEKITPDEIEILDEGQNLRHVFVHNAGRASSKYLQSTKKPGIRVGDRLNLDLGNIYRFSLTALAVGGKLYQDISAKFFDTEAKVPKYKMKITSHRSSAESENSTESTEGETQIDQ